MSKTRSTISLFEYVRILTELSKYLYEIEDLSSLIDTDELRKYNIGLINSSELAYYLLKSGKVNVTINRQNIETVNFSDLEINPQWNDLIESYFNEQRETKTAILKSVVNFM